MDLPDKIYELIKDIQKDGFDFNKLLTMLVVLTIFGGLKYWKRIRKAIKDTYNKVRREDEVKKLKEKLQDIRLRLYTPLYRLEQDDEEFKERVDNLLGKIGALYSEDGRNEVTQDSLTKEIESLWETYEQALFDIKQLVQTISDSLDRADEMSLTREQRIDDITSSLYSEEEVGLQVQSSNKE